jgi:hypothetical protein
MFAILVIAVACKKDFPQNSSINSSLNTQGTSVTVKSAFPIICCIIARPKYNCVTGGGLCDCRLGPCHGSVTREFDLIITDTINNIMEITIDSELPYDADTVHLDNNYVLPAPIARELGLSSITLLAGAYPVMYNNGQSRFAISYN